MGVYRIDETSKIEMCLLGGQQYRTMRDYFFSVLLSEGTIHTDTVEDHNVILEKTDFFEYKDRACP